MPLTDNKAINIFFKCDETMSGTNMIFIADSSVFPRFPILGCWPALERQ